ncbi:MAG: tetratricopeptide repeat protein, partial [Phycisphaerae bacterium]
MRRTIYLVAVSVIVGVASAASAQAPAAFADGRKAYEAGQFEKARDLLLSAARTAPKNAEVFLHLGKAHYQLGELPEAIAAWRRTLQLAPAEPYAAKMLQLLRAEVRDVDVQVKLVEQALEEGLNDWARVTVTNLLAKRHLTEAQRGRLTVLWAEARLALGLYKDVPPAVLEIQTKFPKAADAVQLALLMGRAKIHLDDKSIVAGLKILQGIVADHKDTPAAAIAQYELIRFDLSQGPSAGSVGELAAWFKANGTHRLATDALRLLIDSQLALTRQGPRPTKDSPLAPTDVAAIGYVQLLRVRLPKEADRLKLTQKLEKHFNAHYDPPGAYNAAIQGADALLKLGLSRAERVLLIQRVIDRHLAISRQQPGPAKDAKLAAADLAAITRAGELLALLTTEAEVQKLTQQLLGHLSTHYVKAGAYAAAVQGVEAVLGLALPPGDRLTALKTLASYKTELAIQALGEQAAAGTLPEQMPGSIREVLALYATIRKEFPTQSTSVEEVKLAHPVAALAARLPQAIEVTALSAPDAWAVEIAMAVVRRDAKTGASQAIAFVDNVRKRYLPVQAPTGLRIALDLSGRLLAALGDDHANWASTRLEHARVLGLLAAWQFGENVRLGRDELNAKLSDTQKQMIA